MWLSENLTLQLKENMQIRKSMINLEAHAPQHLGCCEDTAALWKSPAKTEK